MLPNRDKLPELEKAWAVVQTSLQLPVSLETEEAYNHLTQLVDSLLDITRGQPNHPLASLLDLLGSLMYIYEEKYISVPQAPSHEVLRFLMESNNLTQTDLKTELGSQSNVSMILAGKRQLNPRQIAALSKRFHVSPAVFIDEQTNP